MIKADIRCLGCDGCQGHLDGDECYDCTGCPGESMTWEEWEDIYRKVEENGTIKA